MSVGVFICFKHIFLSIYLSLCICQFASLSVCPYVCLWNYFSVCLSVCLSIFFLPTCLSICLSILVSVCFSVRCLCLHVCLYVCVCVFVCVCVSVYPCNCLSLCMSVYLYFYPSIWLYFCLSVWCEVELRTKASPSQRTVSVVIINLWQEGMQFTASRPFYRLIISANTECPSAVACSCVMRNIVLTFTKASPKRPSITTAQNYILLQSSSL